MAHPVIETDECIGCGICVDACPQEVLEVNGGVVEVVNEDNCIACGDCVEECPMGAIPEVVENNREAAYRKRKQGPYLYIGKGPVACRGENPRSKKPCTRKANRACGVFLPEGDSGPQLPGPVRFTRSHLDFRDEKMTAKTALGEVFSRAVLRVCIVFSQFKVLCLLA